MTNTLQKLEAKGFVDVQADPRDGRSKSVTITASGCCARDEAVRAVQPHIDDLERRLNMVEVTELLPGLTRLREILDRDRDARNQTTTDS
jgi:DNA-binding MarR family transcriptional regulator